MLKSLAVTACAAGWFVLQFVAALVGACIAIGLCGVVATGLTMVVRALTGTGW